MAPDNLTSVPLSIRWLGHACFLLTAGEGGAARRIVTDPFPPDMGYGRLNVTADLVTTSHNHFDHNHADAVAGQPRVVAGLGKDDRWQPVPDEVEGVKLKAVPSYHDPQQGSQRGKNTIFVFETAGLRTAHMGDLGHILDSRQVKDIGPVDILLVPVGGFYTIGPAEAGQVVATLAPRLVIPMHYRTEAIADWPIDAVEPFLAGRERVRRVGSNEVTVTRESLPAETEVWVFEYR